jgi:hypothetical protein
MTFPVANFLVDNVFYILDDLTADSRHIGVHEFGVRVRDLPTLMGASHPGGTHTLRAFPPWVVSIASGHTLTSAPPSSLASSRQAPVVLRSLIV